MKSKKSKVTNRERKVPKCISITPSLWDVALALAVEHGVSVSELLSLLIEQEVDSEHGESQAGSLLAR